MVVLVGLVFDLIVCNRVCDFVNEVFVDVFDVLLLVLDDLCVMVEWDFSIDKVRVLLFVFGF